MPTLLFQICAPMQSWGVESIAEKRDTLREPSKSGVIGLLCAAMGRDRDEKIDDLSQLRFGVRADQPGVISSDYQTIKVGLSAAGGRLTGGSSTKVSERYYIADARFLIGIAGDDRKLLQEIDAALQNPVWPLYLGRRAFPPSAPLSLAMEASYKDTSPIVEKSLEQALSEAPPLLTGAGNDEQQVTLFLESQDEVGNVRRDQPIQGSTFAQRQFRYRFVEEKNITIRNHVSA